uniref:receptor protein-tyrosine kinase n=1 Tax=Acrobeloides nanus TaxID=290746 RepID=A0A914DTB2_9BILA
MEHNNADNWLLVPRIQRNEANRLYIEVKFTMRSCAEMPEFSRTCKETLRLYGRQLNNNERLPRAWHDDRQWNLVDTFTAKSEKTGTYVQTSSYEVNSSSAYFSFRDSGTCSSLLYVKIYYEVCPETTDTFVYLPRTISGKDVHSVVTVSGKCIKNASPTNFSHQNPTFICKSDGRWQSIGNVRCECDPGYIPSLKTGTCAACSIGTYKSKQGAGECLPCPTHSYSYNVGSPECRCESGFYRADGESADFPCTQPPTKPSTVRIAEENQTSVTIIWEEPSNLGGRKDIWYSFKCSMCGTLVKSNPSIPYFKARRLTLSNLEPNKHYAVMIFAHNNVSIKSDRRPYELVEFMTKSQDDVRIEEEGAYVGKKNGWWPTGMTLWTWIIFGVIVILAIACFLLFLSRRSGSNRKQMSDLDMLDNYKQGSITPDETRPSSHGGGTPSSFSSWPIMLRRKLNMPLIPVYGAHKSSTIGRKPYKYYVDPSTYEDPNEALAEFTNELDPSLIQVFRQIGVGEFGEVCCGRLTIEGLYGNTVQQVVAVKTLLPGSSGKAKADFLMEASIMGQFQHDNVIQLVGVVTKTEPIMIITEFMLNGALDKFLRSNDNGSISIQQLVEMLCGIASGMKYLNDMGYVHRDLAARNVLVDDRLTCKIADFGLSRGLRGAAATEKVYTTNGGKIPIRWTAPEAIHHHKYTTASDVWSFGIVMWEVCSFGERPYWDWTNQKVITEVDQGYRLPCPMDAPPILHNMMQHCWQWDRHKRPKFAEILTRLTAFANELEEVYGKCRSPGLIKYQSTPILNRDSSHTNQGALLSPSTLAPPNPPSTLPPVLTLEEFLRLNNLGHCISKLNMVGIKNLAELAQLAHGDFLAFGIHTDEAAKLYEAVRSIRYVNSTISHPPPPMPSLRRPVPQLTPIPAARVSGSGPQRSPLLSSGSSSTTQTMLTANGMSKKSSPNFSSDSGFFV